MSESIYMNAIDNIENIVYLFQVVLDSQLLIGLI
jgi:hypothetical protein